MDEACQLYATLMFNQMFCNSKSLTIQINMPQIENSLEVIGLREL